MALSDPRRAVSAYYGASVAEFLATAPEAVIGVLAMADLQGALEAEQRQAWEEEIDILRVALAGLEGMVFLEFDVPRRGSRIDAAIVSGPAVLVVEFKCGERHFTVDACNQVWDYALDLKNFHQASHNARIFPILVATRATDPNTVDAITRNDAGSKNLQVTSGRVEEIIECARASHGKAIVFVTGVPGAGKTLVGLNVATRRRTFGQARAVFLSGNGPLVAVPQEALTRDEYARLKGSERKGAIRQKVKPFIQNVHHFRDEGVRSDAPPFDHVVIFDEAQRAWNHAKTADFMKRRKGRSGFTQSESEFLISYLDRHDTWAVIVCLVGGGRRFTPARPVSEPGWKQSDVPSRNGGSTCRRTCPEPNTPQRRPSTHWMAPCRSNATADCTSRARQGMAIFVPPGDRRDPTRLPQLYDGTFEYLRSVGVSEI